ncbi:MAG: tRNA pseudouridine(55) synthase TruB [Clostridiales bacterium]|nr:tRNA pseudouridine(55) synthase TruB [Clostridiales bacterium]
MFGIINVYKEKDMTSFDVIAKLRKILNESKIGHTGTLDPNATGVLPIAIGKATKLIQYIKNEDKQYFVTMKLGIKTDTLDITGKVLKEKKPPKFQLDKIEEVINSFIGKSEQIPPMYSAKKQNGKKMYQLARLGLEIERQPCKIEIYKIQDVKYNTEEDIITFLVDCSKGTYIRTLCEDIAQKLGTIATVLELERTRAGIFEKEKSYTLDEIKDLVENNEIQKVIYDNELIFSDYTKYIINNVDMERFLNGVKLETKFKDGIYKLYNENNLFIGFGKVEDKKIKRDLII